tara:strand:- start:910 stop:2145 length:1236 start_codon:yes stop_codon:yes gene_type:complete
MADTATITVGGGNSASITVQQQAVLSAVIPDASASVSLDVASSSSPSFDIAVPAVSFDISSSTAFVATVKEQFNTITVSSAIPAVGTTRLRDLEDVKGDPTSGQILVYNVGENNFQFQDQNTGGAGGDDLTDEAITVTNTDGGFSSLVGGTFETGTSITTILKNILDPYKLPQFTSFSVIYQADSNGILHLGGQSKNYEVGTSIVMNNYDYAIDTPSSVLSNSVVLNQNSTSFVSGLSESNTSPVLFPSTSHQSNTPATVTYGMSATENGNPNGITSTISSGDVSINFRYRVAVAAHSVSPSNNTEATTVYANRVSSSLISDPGTSSFDLSCSSANEGESNFTFILIPEPFGTLKSVVQNNSTDVTADFSLVGSSTFTATVTTGIPVAYYIYKTNDPGAFNDGNTLTITLN